MANSLHGQIMTLYGCSAVNLTQKLQQAYAVCCIEHELQRSLHGVNMQPCMGCLMSGIGTGWSRAGIDEALSRRCLSFHIGCKSNLVEAPNTMLDLKAPLTGLSFQSNSKRKGLFMIHRRTSARWPVREAHFSKIQPTQLPTQQSDDQNSLQSERTTLRAPN